MVGSYSHLRKEGLEGYVEDFGGMVKEIWGVTGDTGIEVLPVCPVVFDGIDREGGLLLSGIRDWIGWWGKETGREEMKGLGETGGNEEKEWSEEATIFYRPSGVIVKLQRGGMSELGMRGNMISCLMGGW